MRTVRSIGVVLGCTAVVASCALGHHARRFDASLDGTASDVLDTPGDVCVPVREICDGRDNDCDGVIDNGNPGGGEACDTGMSGACAAGHVQCIDALETCVADRAPAEEACNGFDDDCDGTVDDGDPGGGTACSSPMPGACLAGHVHCVAGENACVSDGLPGSEQCDGIDNDCNGQVDNGFACALGSGTSACTTPCGSTGTQMCFANCSLGPCTPPAEACDLVDDDCDTRCDPPACRQVIYQLMWTDGTNTDRAYSTNPAELAAANYVNEGAVFWTYVSPVPGSYPLYRCYHPTVQRHFVGYAGCLGVPGAGADLLLGYVIGSGACGGLPMYQYYCGASGFVATISGAYASALGMAGCAGAVIGVYGWQGP